MSHTIVISLSPNTAADDVKLAAKVLLSPNTWQQPDVVTQVEQTLSVYFKGAAVATTSSGRQALWQLLQAYGIGAGNEVILQAFTCSAVPAAVKWSKAIPVYADINPATFNLDPVDVAAKITPATRAIIIQHTFGIPGPIEELQRLAKQHNLLLLEDCAHALGATYKNQPVGTFGDAAFLSFGRDKTLSSVFGGAVVSHNKTIIDAIKARQAQLPYPSAVWVIQQLIHPLLFSVIVPMYFTASFGKALLVVAQKLGLLSKAVEASEKLGQPPRHTSYRFSPALAQLLRHQLGKLAAYTTHRQHLARHYIHELHGIDGTQLPWPSSHSQPSWLRFPWLVPDAVILRRRAQKYRFLLGDWYDTVIAPRDVKVEQFNYQPGSCPKAEEVAGHVVNLPTHPRLSEADTAAVIRFVKETVRT